MSEGDAGRREARIATAVCLVLAGSAVASGVSPALEWVLDWWVGVPVCVVGGLVVARLVARSVWLSLLLHWEATRPLHPDELQRPEREEA